MSGFPSAPNAMVIGLNARSGLDWVRHDGTGKSDSRTEADSKSINAVIWRRSSERGIPKYGTG